MSDFETFDERTNAKHAKSMLRRSHRFVPNKSIVVLATLILLTGLIIRISKSSSPPPSSSSTSVAATATALNNGGMAPNATLTTVGGRTLPLNALRGKPTMLWFLVAGCASCVSSVPAVEKQLTTLKADGVRVVSVALYGDLPQTGEGRAEFSDFMSSVATNSTSNSEWTWGLASKSLSYTFDPQGIPDLYYLIGPRGHIRYHNSVPVSTMPQLLAAAGSLHHAST